MEKQLSSVIWVRVSSKEQADTGYSLDAQLKLLEDYCRNQDFKVEMVYKIAETASKEKARKTFNEMLQFLKDKNIKRLVVEKTDRFSRNLKDAVAIDDWMNADETRALHAVKENLILHKNAKSDVKFMWNIHLAVAKKYTDNLREEVMKGWAEKLAQGWMPAPPPPGYRTVLIDRKKVHEPDPKTMNAMKRVFKLYLEPEHSIRTIGDEMYKMGVVTRAGRPYTKANVYKILKNPFYIGKIHFNGKNYPGSQKPLITEGLFNAVQEKLNGRSPGRKIMRDYTLKGLLTCVYCDKLITWWKVKGYVYGACQRKCEDCKKKKFVREDQVHDVIQKCLDDLICPSDEVMDWVVGMINNKVEDIHDNRQETLDHLNSEVKRLSRMDELLYDDKLNGEISVERYKQKHEEFQTQIQALTKQIDDFDDTLKAKHEEGITIVKLSQEAAKIYKELEDNEQKRCIITKLISSLVVEDKSVSVKFTNYAEVIAQASTKLREYMKIANINNLTFEKDLFTRGETGLSSQSMAVRLFWCGLRDSNSRPLPWQGSALNN